MVQSIFAHSHFGKKATNKKNTVAKNLAHLEAKLSCVARARLLAGS